MSEKTTFSPSSDKLLQEKYEALTRCVQCLFSFKRFNKHPFRSIAEKIFSSNVEGAYSELNTLFPKSETWKTARYEKFNFLKLIKYLIQKKKIGLLIRN